MSATLCEEPVRLRSVLTLGAELSLGALLARAYEEVDAHGVADCPVCAHPMRGDVFEARCDTCGARLS